MVRLNYFTSGACVKIVDGELKILVVHYYDDSDHKKVHEYRLPGGTIQFIDIVSTIQRLGPKLNLLPAQYSSLISRIEELSRQTENKINLMQDNTNEQKVNRRNLFVEALKKAEAILIKVLPTLTELKLFQREVQLTTLRRELEQECAVATFTDAIDCGHAQRGEHTQYPYLILGADAPDSYKGGSDKDIVESLFMTLDEVCINIYKYHRLFLSNALSKLSHIWGYEKDKSEFVKKIDHCLKENQV